MRTRTFPLIVLTVALLALPEQSASSTGPAGGGFPSGPPVGQLHGGPFQPYLVNLRKGKDRLERPRCPVGEFGTRPVVAIFVREGPESNEATLQELFTKVDGALEKHQDDYLGGFAIFITDQAKSSISQKTEDNDKLVKEAKVREKHLKRLREMAQPLKHLLIGTIPDTDQLKRWNINPKPGVTVVFYAKHKVLGRSAFAEGKLRGEDINGLVKGFDELLKKSRQLADLKK
ncbi:MAG: hypothetical protein L0Z62_44095 [Gemmataceae bacterium]|nr:hypothetical protein [Gemmataceae bacterium]